MSLFVCYLFPDPGGESVGEDPDRGFPKEGPLTRHFRLSYSHRFSGFVSYYY